MMTEPIARLWGFFPVHTVTTVSFFPHTQETPLQVLLQKLANFSNSGLP